MGIKAVLNPDHIPTNKYQMIIVGMPSITFTNISGLELEVDMVDLPDRTRATGGNPKAVEFTATMPMHHAVELAAMEIWFEEAQDPVSLTYKKAGTLIMTSGSGDIVKTYSMIGIFCSKRKLPDLSFESEGDMAEVEWTFQVDTLLPI
tara:strand:- start:546 stop:989 length:444 start_codon:yes stop_codon:yes gene_type:complete